MRQILEFQIGKEQENTDTMTKTDSRMVRFSRLLHRMMSLLLLASLFPRAHIASQLRRTYRLR